MITIRNYSKAHEANIQRKAYHFSRTSISACSSQLGMTLHSVTRPVGGSEKWACITGRALKRGELNSSI